MTYYKAVRPNGSSFHDSSFRWLPEDGVIPENGWLAKHPDPAERITVKSRAKASRYLSVSTEPADCTGFRWPCRLLVVEPNARPAKDDLYPHKMRVRSARVVDEVESWRAFGPNGRQVVAFITLLSSLPLKVWSAAQVEAWSADWFEEWNGARVVLPSVARRALSRRAAVVGAQAAAADVARRSAWSAVRDAAHALVLRDLLTPDHFTILTALTSAMGVNFNTLGGTE